ncbi:MAG: hypothetical protein M1354_02020 [Candidatus Marsarchaeota archaeon]|nr:hypothetical protein [Candidatus Marsarchaeota archaeon]
MAASNTLGVGKQQFRSLNGRPQDAEQIADHLWEHVKYPASRRSIISACGGLECLNSEEDRRWLMENLYDGTFRNAREVEKSLNIE